MKYIFQVRGVPLPNVEPYVSFFDRSGQRRAKPVVFKNADVQAWQASVVLQVRTQRPNGFKILDCPLKATWNFRLPMSQRVERAAKRGYPECHVVKPDTDNLAKPVKDALEGLIYTNDSRICNEIIVKSYAFDGDVGVTITIESEDAK